MTTLRQRQTSSSAVTEKPRDESAILKGRVTLRLNFKLRVNFAPISMDRQIRKCPYYNYAVGTFHTKKLCRKLYSIEFKFYLKNKNRFLSHSLWDLRVTYTLHLQLIGKSVVDFLFVMFEFFRYLLRLRRCKRKSVEAGVFRRKWVTLSPISDRRGGTHQPLLVSENQNECPFTWYQNIRSALCGFVTKHACDRQTDRQNIDS